MGLDRPSGIPAPRQRCSRQSCSLRNQAAGRSFDDAPRTSVAPSVGTTRSTARSTSIAPARCPQDVHLSIAATGRRLPGHQRPLLHSTTATVRRRNAVADGRRRRIVCPARRPPAWRGVIRRHGKHSHAPCWVPATRQRDEGEQGARSSYSTMPFWSPQVPQAISHPP